MRYTGAPPRRPGPPLWLALVLLASGIVLAFATAAVFAAKAIGTDNSAPTFSTPGSERVYLRAGGYDVFTDAKAGILSASDVSITNTAGSPMATNQLTSGQSFSDGGTTYRAALTFQVTQSGQYSIDVTADADYSAIAPDLTTIISWNGGWLAGLLVSLIVGLTGLVLLVVGLIRRSQSKRQAALAGGSGGFGTSPPWPGQPWPARGMPPPGSPPHGTPPLGGASSQPWQQPQWPPPSGWPATSSLPGPAAVTPQAGYPPPGPSAPPHPSGWSPHPTPRTAEPVADRPPGDAEPAEATAAVWSPYSADQRPPPSGGLGP